MKREYMRIKYLLIASIFSANLMAMDTNSQPHGSSFLDWEKTRYALKESKNSGALIISPILMTIYSNDKIYYDDWNDGARVLYFDSRFDSRFDDSKDMPSRKSLSSYKYASLRISFYDKDHKEVGYATVEFNNANKNKQAHIYFRILYIDDKYRNLGYAKMALEGVQKVINESFHDFKLIELVVSSQMPKMALMVKNWGFELCPEARQKLKEQKIVEQDYLSDCTKVDNIRFFKTID